MPGARWCCQGEEFSLSRNKFVGAQFRRGFGGGRDARLPQCAHHRQSSHSMGGQSIGPCGA
eukprot:9490373-Pyramimonas_sp.AAC.1